MPLNAFIVRPFGVKEIIVSDRHMPERLKSYQPTGDEKSVLRRVEKFCTGSDWKVSINFEAIHERLVARALRSLNISGDTTDAIVVAGNIREDMFHRLITADLVIADLSMHNANVYYELGIRQAFRDKYTFLIRSNLTDYPFDLQTDRYFAYDIAELLETNDKHVETSIKPPAERLAEALRSTIMSYKADSPVFKLMPKLEAEDRSRFITVPHEFREEVERAQQLRLPEHLRVLAVECADTLWEVEGLRAVGRAQFESNFIDDAKVTWEQIVSRYPDDIEANTILSTVYQRRNDATRSDQALARISRVSSMTPNRQSQLRSLNGRNLKEEWTKQWIKENDLKQRQLEALRSPLLQRAYDAFEDAFKRDLNNTYAGLNALTLLLIQTELAEKLSKDWGKLQRRPGDIKIDLQRRYERIGQLIAALELAVESERDRLRREGSIDPWFNLLEASVACIVSQQPEYVAQLYEDARHFAPVDSERSMYRSLEIYEKLGIGKREESVTPEKSQSDAARTDRGPRTVGTIAENLKRAIEVMKCASDDVKKPGRPRRILLFAGLRIDVSSNSLNQRVGFPEERVQEVKALIKKAIENERGLTHGSDAPRGSIVFGIAAAAHGGDLLFHDVCDELKIPTRMCLALPRAEYIGRYVAPAGPEWVEKFSAVYRNVDEERNKKSAATAEDGQTWSIHFLADSNELPRWLQGRPYYNVGRRNNLWMLQHAIVAANQLGENTEITLITLNDDKTELGMGGIGHLIEQAKLAGIKVKKILMPDWKDEKQNQSNEGDTMGGKSTGSTPPPKSGPGRNNTPPIRPIEALR
jgi:hypothetical protein